MVASDKGGVGKTTCATSLAHGLARQGQSVLLVDFDLLGQDAIALGLDPEAGVYDYLVGQAPAEAVLQETGRAGLWLLPGNSWTRRADDLLRTRRLDEAIARLRALAAEYDATVIDTHPSGYLQELAIRVADAVVLPVRCEALAMDGVVATWQLVDELGNPQQRLIVPTLYDERLSSHRANLHLLQTAYPGLVTRPVLARVAVAEAHAEGCTVWEYANRRGELDKVRAAYTQMLDWLSVPANELLFGTGRMA